MGPGGVWEGAWVATPRPRLCQQSSSSAGEAAPGVLLFPAQGSGAGSLTRAPRSLPSQGWVHGALLGPASQCIFKIL